MPSSPSKHRFFHRFLQSLTSFTGFYLVIGYVLGYTLWWKHWAVGFWLLAMPLAMSFMAILTVIWFMADVRKAWIPFLLVLIGWPFWQRTIGLHAASEKMPQGKSVEVITFNVSGFRLDDYFDQHNTLRAEQLLQWTTKTSADIICVQEAADWKNENLPAAFHTFEKFARAGYRYSAGESQTPPFHTPLRQHMTGVAIFSKHPIISVTNMVFKGSNGVNGLVVADIRKDNDTLRVISLHLMSMGVRVGRVMKATDSRAAKSETRNILHKLKEGFISHNLEMEPVIKAIRNSPYPVILCGDLNEVPTGLSYGRARRYLKNSFEEAGKGFGFTLNRSPWFIRIDNQFHSNHFTVVSHQVVRSVSASDHFPVRVRYRY